MKPHIGIKFRQGYGLPRLPHWKEILDGKADVPGRFQSDVDTLLSQYGIAVWPTLEYQPKQETWSPREKAAGVDRIYRLILRQDQGIPPRLISNISLLPVVEKVHIGHIEQALLPDPRIAQHFSTRAGSAARNLIFLKQAHAFTQGDPSVVVAVLDTGVDADHPELRDAVRPGFDFVDIIDGAKEFLGDYTGADADAGDEVGHGNHVAGIIAGRGLAMPAGVVPQCKILPVRVLAAMKRGGTRVGAGLLDNINAGIKWAIDQGVDVINMSLGIRHTGGGLPHEEVVNYAREMGVTIVAASGNDGQEQLYYPGALKGVIAVGAVDENGDIASYSTYGRQVSLVAPGSAIYSAYLGGKYAFSSGTSQAAPFVSGAVALLKSFAKSAGKTLSDGQVKHILKHTADKIDRRFKHPKAGFGRINLIDALRLLKHKLT